MGLPVIQFFYSIGLWIGFFNYSLDGFIYIIDLSIHLRIKGPFSHLFSSVNVTLNFIGKE